MERNSDSAPGGTPSHYKKRIYNSVATSSKNLTTSSQSQSAQAPSTSTMLPKKLKHDCNPSESTSHTAFYKMDRQTRDYTRITREEHWGHSESISTSDTFQCVHGEAGRQYTEKGLLKRNLVKELDPIKIDPKWKEPCPPVVGWELVRTVEFLVTDPMGTIQVERLTSDLKDLAIVTENGFKIDLLDSICTIIDYLVESLRKYPKFRQYLVPLLKNMKKPILLNVNSDIVTHFEELRDYLGYLSYLLIRMKDEDLFDMVAEAIQWQLTAPKSRRGEGAVELRTTLAAATSTRFSAVAMIALSKSRRFPVFVDIAFVLACDTVQNCLEMLQQNVLENIFYRFNPYFPERDLPYYDINPADVRDVNLKLGDSSVNISSVLSLLLVLLKTLHQYQQKNPKYADTVPCPDKYAQMCLAYAYRFECRAPEHRHQRNTLTVVITVLLKIFQQRLHVLSYLLSADMMALSIQTEVKPRSVWTQSVIFNTFQTDVQFKKLLIYYSVEQLKIFPHNSFMVRNFHWLTGLMYLLDPGLSHMRAKWSLPLFAEIRKAAFQALVVVIPKVPPKWVIDCGLMRRVMWYIEWYTENPYELSVLYWCLRLMQVSIFKEKTASRRLAVKGLFDTHGIIILMNLCKTLLDQKLPPIEKNQCILALALRLITSCLMAPAKLSCCVYPKIKWPAYTDVLAERMLDVVMYSLEKSLIINDRWIISLLSFIWQAIIWNDGYRETFCIRNGLYKLLDLITMTKPAVQCMALALICDITRAGESVAQLITWRAGVHSSMMVPRVVKRGATIATLLASIFRDECRATDISIDSHGILAEPVFLLMSAEMRGELIDFRAMKGVTYNSELCLAAADMAGSRLSKAYTILCMLSEDLEWKVSLTDEAYKLYKNIELAPEDESTLVLCIHYLTMKLNEAWVEASMQLIYLEPEDRAILDEFLHIGQGWAKEIEQQQRDVIKKDTDKETEKERSLYAFLGRVRMNVALCALRDLKCVARSTDRARVVHLLLHEAVLAHHRRLTVMSEMRDTSLQKTYTPFLDEVNYTGQHLKIFSIAPPKFPRPPHTERTSIDS